MKEDLAPATDVDSHCPEEIEALEHHATEPHKRDSFELDAHIIVLCSGDRSFSSY